MEETTKGSAAVSQQTLFIIFVIRGAVRQSG